MRSKSLAATFALSVLVLMCGSTTVEAQKVAFVTSVIGTGDFSSWPDALGASGVDAGDAVCQARALAGGLSNPGDFVAWLSDIDDDAYCRLHGLSGKVGANCGLASLPADAGPWVRTDGVVWAEDITQMLAPNGKVYTPLLLDEDGFEPPTYYAWTGTTDTGELDTGRSQCTDWTVTSGEADAGRRTRTTTFWTASDGIFCTSSARLVCLEAGGAGPPLPDQFFMGERVAFVTSVRGPGNLSLWDGADGATGIDAGDNICQYLAENAILDDFTSFKAWLSDGSIDAKLRFDHDGRWVRPDGIKIADDIADLCDGEIFTSVAVTETGEYKSEWQQVWTGTLQDGTVAPLHCSNWGNNTSGSQGRVGYSSDATGLWTDGLTPSCNFSYHLYCFSDVPAGGIFKDGFETGDTSGW